MIFKQIDSSVDKTRKTLALFNKDWNTYKSNWQNANGLFGKIGSIFSSSKVTSNNIISNNQLQILRNWNNAVKHGCTNQETFNRIIADADENTKMYFAGLNKGKGSVEGLKNAQNTAETSTIGLTIAQTALNTAINMGIGLAISYAIKGISKLINYQKELIDKSQEAISVFEESRDALTNNKQTIDEISSDYTRLAQGVDSLGRNVSLNTEEYARYNEIVNQIADMFPQMVQGYTDEGNAIIINKGNVEELTKAYEEQKKAYQDLVITKSADTFAGYKAKVAETPWTESLKGKNGTYAYIEQKKYIDELIKSLEDGEQAFENFYSNQYIKNSDIYNVLNSATKTAGIDWGGVMDTDKRYEQMKSQMTKLYAYQRQLISNINTETSKIKPIMSAYMGQSYDYQSLDSDVQDVVKQIVGQFDSEFYTQFDNETDMATWVTENIVNKFKGIDGEKITEAFKNSIDLKTKLQNGEISLDDYLSGINEFKMLIDGFDDNTKKSVDLIFNVNSSNGLSTDTLINNVKEKLQDDFDDKVGELTLEELHIAAEQIEVPEGTLLSWDELKAKIKEVQDSTLNFENPISLSISETIDQLNTQLKPAFDSLKSAYQDIFTDDGFTPENVDLSMFDSIKSKLDELNKIEGITVDYSAFEDFVKVLNNAESKEQDVENAFDSLATSITKTLSGLEDFDTLKAALEDLGVVNNELVAFDALISNTEALKEAFEKANVSMDDFIVNTKNGSVEATEAGQAFIEEMVGAENVAQAIAMLAFQKELCNLQEMNTANEVANLKTLAENAGYTSDIIENLTELEQIYQQVASGTLTPGQLDDKLARAAELEEAIKGLASNINYEPKVDFSNVGGGASKAGSAGKDAGDAYVDAFEAELKDLQNLRDSGVIDEKEYLDRLRALYQKYFKDKKKYAEQYAKYERQYLEGMKSLYDSALSGISKLMSSQIDGYNDAKEAAVSSLTEEKEARLAVIDAQKEQLEAEQDLIDEQIEEKQKIIDGIQNEIDAMKEANSERQRQLDLQKAQYELERMMHQRPILQYNEDKGMHYVNDGSGARDAKEKVDDAKFEIEVAKKEKEIKLIEEEIDLLDEQKDAIQDQIDALDKQADSIEKYYSKMISEQEKYFDSLINNMEKQKSKWEEFAEIEEIAKAYSAIEQVFGDMGYTVQDILNGNEQAFEDFKSKYISLMNDMNSNSSFAEGLSYATGVAEENLGSFLDKTKEASDGISDLSAKSSEVDSVAESMDKLSDSATTASTGTGEIASNMGELNTNTEGLSDNLNSIGDALTGIPETDKFDALTTSFANLGDAIKGIADALGVDEKGTVGGLVGSLKELSELSLGEEDAGIISQFNNLKEAVGGVTSAISGGGSSGGKGSDASSSSSASMTAGVDGGSTSGLVGAIESFKNATEKALGTGGGENNEGKGTKGSGAGAIGQFEQLNTTVDDVTTAIGSENSEGGEGDGDEADNLIGSITNLGETSAETLGESGGDGVIGKFEEFKGVIEEAANHVTSISDGLEQIDEQEVECTIRVNIETTGGLPSGLAGATGTALDTMNLNSIEYNAKYTGNAHYEGTAKVTGDWGVKNGGNTLVGELGQELIVFPNGRFKTVGDNGAEFVDIPNGSIVFNHLQTKELLSKGNLVGRGKALASGTALAQGNAHADGTDDSIWTTLADGTKVRPLQPGDKMYDMVQKFDTYFKSIDGNLEKLVPNSVYEHQRQMEDMAKYINYVSNVTNNNRNTQPIVNNINVTCPSVTSQQVAEQLGSVLGKELDKQFSGFHNYTDQRSRIR